MIFNSLYDNFNLYFCGLILHSYRYCQSLKYNKLHHVDERADVNSNTDLFLHQHKNNKKSMQQNIFQWKNLEGRMCISLLLLRLHYLSNNCCCSRELDSIIGLNPQGINNIKTHFSYGGNNSFQGHKRVYLYIISKCVL